MNGPALKINPRVADPVEVNGRSVLVVGAARSGLAAARLLMRLGADVTVCDAKPMDEIAAAEELSAAGVRVVDRCERLDKLPAPELAVLSPGVPLHAQIVKDLMARGIPVIGELELAWQFCPARMVAVTGTNGKGTTCRLCAQMLAASGLPVELAGNIGRPLAACVEQLTDEHIVVVEVSSFQLSTVRTFAPHVAALLNIAPDHLDWHPSLEDYAAAKRRIFANQRPGDLAIVVIDDPAAAAAVEHVRGELVRVSLRQPAEVFYRHGVIELSLPNKRSSVHVPQLEEWPEHLVTDALVAAAAALRMGANEEAIREAIRSYSHPDHLMKEIAVVQGVRFIDDSKATNVSSAVADLKGLAKNGAVVVITGGKDKGTPLDAWAEAIASHAKAAVLIGETAAQLAALLPANLVHPAGSMDEAVQIAFSLARPGETVALIPAASSFDMFADYADRGEKFAAAVGKLADRRNTGDRR